MPRRRVETEQATEQPATFSEELPEPTFADAPRAHPRASIEPTSAEPPPSEPGGCKHEWELLSTDRGIAVYRCPHCNISASGPPPKSKRSPSALRGGGF